MVAFRLVPLGVMLVLAVAGCLWGVGWSTRCAAAPWVVSLVCVGLPHGAADLAVARRRMTGRGLVIAAGGYLAVLAVSLLGFVAAPEFVLPAFVVLSAWHFGLPLGGLAVGVPLVAWPDAAAGVADAVAAVVGWQSQFAPALVRSLGLAVGAAALVAVICAAVQAARHTGWRGAAVGLLDAAVVTLLAVTTDPLFSVGVFFLCWHAWREMPHVVSEITARTPCLPAGVGLLDGVSRVHRAALPLLVPTWLALGAAWWLLPEQRLEHSLRGLAILSLAAYVVLTPPHVAAVRLAGRMGGGGRADVVPGRPSPAGSEPACTAITRSRPRLRPFVGASSVGSTTGCFPGPTRPTG